MFDSFRDRMMVQGGQMGKALKRQSDMIMDATFPRDIAFRKCYLQDKDTIFPEQTIWSYKQAKDVYTGRAEYDPKELKGFSPIDAKWLLHTYLSISKSDAVDMYLEFRPNVHGMNPNIRVGAYVFIPNDLGKYELWMIVQRDDRPQFPQFYVLKCDLLLKWYISHDDVPNYEGVHMDIGSYFTWAIARTQSSYNSGVWTDYLTTSPENTKLAWVPTNDDTRTITYNHHFTISDNPYNRMGWEVSKRDDTAPIGVTKLTFKQEQAVETLDDPSWVNTITDKLSDTEHGINYDFFQPRTNDVVQHTPADEQIADNSIISFSGVKPNLKCGGSYKTYTANFYQNEEFVEYQPYWKIVYAVANKPVCEINFIYDGESLVPDNTSENFIISSDRKILYKLDGKDVFGIQYSYDASTPNNLKLRSLSILDMIGNKLIITADNASGTLSASIEAEVDGL